MNNKLEQIPKKESLRRRLSLPLGLVIFLAVIISSGLLSWSGFQRELSSKVELFNGTAKVFSSSISESLSQSNKRQVLLNLRAIREFKSFKFVAVKNNDGSTFAEMGFGTYLKRNGDSISQHSNILFQKDLWISNEVIQAGKKIGELRLLVDISNVKDRFLYNLAWNFAIALISAFIASRVSWVLISKLTKPVSELSNLMKDLGEVGQYNARAPEDGKGEIKELAQSFNRMISDIQKRDKELLDYQETLETKVEDRTKDLLLAKNLADKANAAKSEFLATMSHEIRTPMNGMLLMSELLATAELSPKYQRYADVIMKSGKSLLAIINDILDFSKIQSGKLELETVEVKTQEVVEDVMSLFWQKAKEKQIDMACYINTDVPEIFSSDPTRLNQILSNLVNNALKFTSEGSVTLHVSVVPTDQTKTILEFKVQDTGIGIKQENLHKVFESFSQADQSTTRKFGGTGLGLPICKKLIEAMNGKISVTSTLDEGSSFIFTIPIDETPQIKRLKPAKNKSVLLVLEDTMSAQFIANAFAEYDVRVRKITPEQYAISEIQLDEWLVAETNTLEKLIKDKPEQYAVAVTQLGDAGIDNLIKANRVHDIISMPLSSISIRMCVERLINGAPLGHKLLESNNSGLEGVSSYKESKVLVVDDSAVNREVIVQALSRFDINPIVVGSGKEAILEFSESSFDAVLMDCSMPEMDGFEASRRLREIEAIQNRSKTPIIALTAHIAENIEEQIKEATMDDIVTKPFTIQTIGKSLSEWLVPSAEIVQEKTPLSQQHIEEQINVSLDDGVFDYASLQNLREISGDAFEETLIQLQKLYLASAPEGFKALVDAVNNEQFIVAQEASHALKSMSMNIGAVTLGKTCQKLEDVSALRDLDAMNSHLFEVAKAFYCVIEEMNKIKQNNLDLSPEQAVI